MEIRILSKPGCHLCDKAKAVIERVAGAFDVTITEVDITGDAELEAKYRFHIPVVLIDGKERARHRVSEEGLRKLLTSIAPRR